MSTTRIAFLALVLSGCGASHHDEAATMAGQLDDARAENARHHQAVMSAGTMDAVSIELDRHEAAMSDVMGTMHGTMDDMHGHCGGDGMPGMMAMMEGMDAALAGHRADVMGAPDVDEARTVCAEHVAAMDGMMDEMMASLDDAGCM
jgi:hypothetical protein